MTFKVNKVSIKLEAEVIYPIIFCKKPAELYKNKQLHLKIIYLFYKLTDGSQLIRNYLSKKKKKS